MKKIATTLLFAALSAAALTACVDAPAASSDQVQRRAQEQLSAQSNAEVGMPAITRFQEKRMAKDILELRDKAIATITYTQDMNGTLHKLCDSVGYGLPYATQYTNPQRPIGSDYQGHPLTTMPQADPNGLFSPASADGTWILCVNPDTQKPVPLYVEPHVIVSPMALKGAK